MKNKKTVTEAAEIITQASEAWSGKGSIFALSVRVARKQSKDPVFNVASWLMYNYGPFYSGETEEDWIRSAKNILKIVK